MPVMLAALRFGIRLDIGAEHLAPSIAEESFGRAIESLDDPTMVDNDDCIDRDIE
jgi:hypothetical protein